MNYDDLSDRHVSILASGHGFLRFYNERHGSRYRIVHVGSRDLQCFDAHTDIRLNLDICLLEVPSGDVRTGPERSGPDSTLERITERLRVELNAPQHPDTALLLRPLPLNFSCDWWTRQLLLIPWSRVGFGAESFDRGIWVPCVTKRGPLSPGRVVEGTIEFMRIDPYRPYRSSRPITSRRNWQGAKKLP